MQRISSVSFRCILFVFFFRKLYQIYTISIQITSVIIILIVSLAAEVVVITATSAFVSIAVIVTSVVTNGLVHLQNRDK